MHTQQKQPGIPHELSGRSLIQVFGENPLQTYQQPSLTLEEIVKAATLPLHPEKTEAFLVVKSIKEIVDRIKQLLGANIRGLVFDDRGTLRPHDTNTYPPEVVETLKAFIKIRKQTHNKVKISIYPNLQDGMDEDFLALSQLLHLPLPNQPYIVPRPHPIGFQRAAEQMFLSPQQCATVSHSILRNNGGIEAGMQQILVDPPKGKEPLLTRWQRAYERKIKELHDKKYHRNH